MATTTSIAWLVCVNIGEVYKKRSVAAESRKTDSAIKLREKHHFLPNILISIFIFLCFYFFKTFYYRNSLYIFVSSSLPFCTFFVFFYCIQFYHFIFCLTVLDCFFSFCFVCFFFYHFVSYMAHMVIVSRLIFNNIKEIFGIIVNQIM